MHHTCSNAKPQLALLRALEPAMRRRRSGVAGTRRTWRWCGERPEFDSCRRMLTRTLPSLDGTGKLRGRWRGCVQSTRPTSSSSLNGWNVISVSTWCSASLRLEMGRRRVSQGCFFLSDAGKPALVRSSLSAGHRRPVSRWCQSRATGGSNSLDCELASRFVAVIRGTEDAPPAPNPKR